MILQLDHVNSYYDKSHILFDLSLDVKEGDSVCILGRNGVGKTTTMKTIMGMLNPKVHAHTEGSIVFDGAQINGQPFLNGSNESPLAKGSFVGFTSYHTKAHLLRAVYEGVVFSHVTHIKRLLRNHDIPESISLTGGVTNSKIWVQMFADILQIPIDVIQEKESGAQGAAIAASIASGVYLNFEEAVRNMVHVSHTVQPRRGMRDIYEKKYAAYRKVIEALSPVWPYLE